jgi:hypothetical protein
MPFADPWALEGCTIEADDITCMPRSIADAIQGQQRFELRFIGPDGVTDKVVQVDVEQFYVSAAHVLEARFQPTITIAKNDR